MSRKAAKPALQYEHRRGRPASPRAREKRERPWLVALVVLPLTAAVAAAVGVSGETWGPEAWGNLAPDWPGGGYGFGITLGVLEAVTAGLFIAPLTRVKFKKAKVRSVAWAAAALPGMVAFGLVSALTLWSMRPRRRRRNGSCYYEGHSCWVHEQYPYVWLVSLLATVAVGLFLLFSIGIHFDRRRKAPAST
ncbi:hypothetical protein [Streptomyces sp. S.PB5]|uniref:hypothetical protein n=1 Tax=Streptomyces sp. S.PB5 TaxID=3020844 RepID=UPI0025B27759|nr:hypothetical protein [Streptomyces sp. S.PB5]MDN3024825.1 hypothetical protein [Streptomyces sp. S.PB5]